MNALRVTDPIPCMGWCQGENGLEARTVLYRSVGNDIDKANRARDLCLEQGIACECSVCSAQLLRLSEVFSHHGAMLDCRRRHDHSGAIVAAKNRGRILSELGHTAL